MTERFDLAARRAHVATAADTFECDLGVRDGRVAALAALPAGAGAHAIDAAGRS